MKHAPSFDRILSLLREAAPIVDEALGHTAEDLPARIHAALRDLDTPERVQTGATSNPTVFIHGPNCDTCGRPEPEHVRVDVGTSRSAQICPHALYRPGKR